MAKSSEKPRLRQIPSSEDMEAEVGHPEGGGERSDQARGRLESARPGASVKEPERTQKPMQPQEELVLQQVPWGWRVSRVLGTEPGCLVLQPKGVGTV